MLNILCLTLFIVSAHYDSCANAQVLNDLVIAASALQVASIRYVGQWAQRMWILMTLQ